MWVNADGNASRIYNQANTKRFEVRLLACPTSKKCLSEVLAGQLLQRRALTSTEYRCGQFMRLRWQLEGLYVDADGGCAPDCEESGGASMAEVEGELARRHEKRFPVWTRFKIQVVRSDACVVRQQVPHGYALGLTSLPVKWLGFAAPLGAKGFWTGAIAGMALSGIAVAGYFLFVSRPV